MSLRDATSMPRAMRPEFAANHRPTGGGATIDDNKSIFESKRDAGAIPAHRYIHRAESRRGQRRLITLTLHPPLLATLNEVMELIGKQASTSKHNGNLWLFISAAF